MVAPVPLSTVAVIVSDAPAGGFQLTVWTVKTGPYGREAMTPPEAV